MSKGAEKDHKREEIRDEWTLHRQGGEPIPAGDLVILIDGLKFRGSIDGEMVYAFDDEAIAKRKFRVFGRLMSTFIRAGLLPSRIHLETPASVGGSSRVESLEEREVQRTQSEPSNCLGLALDHLDDVTHRLGQGGPAAMTFTELRGVAQARRAICRAMEMLGERELRELHVKRGIENYLNERELILQRLESLESKLLKLGIRYPGQVIQIPGMLVMSMAQGLRQAMNHIKGHVNTHQGITSDRSS